MSNFVAVLVVFDAYNFALAVEAGCEVVYVCVGWDVLRVVHVVIIGAVEQTPTSSRKFLVFLCALPGLEPGRMPSALFAGLSDRQTEFVGKIHHTAHNNPKKLF